jgi:hypothetical protein
MPDDKYKVARASRGTPDTRIVIEGVDEPAKNFASHMPKDYPVSSDVEDKRHPGLFEQGEAYIDSKVNPVK